MSKFSIFLALTAIASNVGLSDSVGQFESSRIVSSGNWKTNFHAKIKADHRKSYGSIFVPILLPSKPLREEFEPNFLNITKEDIHLNLNNDVHHKTTSKNSEFVDFDKYVSFGKPYIGKSTSTIIDPAIQSISLNNPLSIDNLNKSVEIYNESIELENHSVSKVLNKYVNFGKPYKAGDNFTINVLKQALENPNRSQNETTDEDELSNHSFGGSNQNNKSSTSSFIRFDEAIQLSNYSDQVDFDKYVSFGKPYKNGTNENADISTLGLLSQFNAIDDTAKVNSPRQKTSFKIPFNESSLTGTLRNNTISSEHISRLDQNPVLEGANSTTQIDFSRNNSNVMSVNAHEALGLPISFQLPIEEHNYLENSEAEILETKCERLEGKPLVVCINENSKNVSTITFDVPSKDSTIIAALMANALFKNNTNLTDVKALRGINEVLNVTRSKFGPVVVTYNDTPEVTSAENVSYDAQSKYLGSNSALNGQNVSQLILEENIARRFFEGSQINKSDELKYEELIDASNYDLDSSQEGSGEAP